MSELQGMCPRRSSPDSAGFAQEWEKGRREALATTRSPEEARQTQAARAKANSSSSSELAAPGQRSGQ